MAPAIARGDGDHLIEPSVAQCVSGVTDESARLPAGSVVTAMPVANDDQRVNQHQREQGNIAAAEQVHRTPQKSDVPPAPFCVQRVETDFEHSRKGAPQGIGRLLGTDTA